MHVYVCACIHVCGYWWRLKVMELLERGIEPWPFGRVTSALNHSVIFLGPIFKSLSLILCLCVCVYVAFTC